MSGHWHGKGGAWTRKRHCWLEGISSAGQLLQQMEKTKPAVQRQRLEKKMTLHLALKGRVILALKCDQRNATNCWPGNRLLSSSLGCTVSNPAVLGLGEQRLGKRACFWNLCSWPPYRCSSGLLWRLGVGIGWSATAGLLGGSFFRDSTVSLPCHGLTIQAERWVVEDKDWEMVAVIEISPAHQSLLLSTVPEKSLQTIVSLRLTQADLYHFLWISNALDSLTGFSWWSLLDTCSGYWQVALATGLKKKTVFNLA